MKDADKITDIELIERVQKGQSTAFSTLKKRYAKVIKGYILACCKNDEDAQDLEQEVWIYIYKKINIYNSQYAFYTFARTLAKYMVLRYYRARAKAWTTYDDSMKLDAETDFPAVSAQSAQDTLEQYWHLLRITFTQGGPPHQLLSFGLNKLISGYGPNDIWEKCSLVLFRKLLKILIQGYIQESFLPEDEVRECFRPLEMQMEKRVKEVLKEKNSLDIFRHILEKIVGKTCFNDYYGKNPIANISDWSYKVKIRVLKIMKNKSTCENGPFLTENIYGRGWQ